MLRKYLLSVILILAFTLSSTINIYSGQNKNFFFKHHKGHKKPSISAVNISITPDKTTYSLGEQAVFNIEVKDKVGKYVSLGPGQIFATFPDEDTLVNLTYESIGKYIYITPNLTEPGNHTLTVEVYSKKGIETITKLEEIIAKTEKTIEYLEELKEKIHSEWIKRGLDRAIEELREIIKKVEERIAEIEEKELLGSAESTIELIASNPSPMGPDAGYVHGIVYNSSTDEPLSGAIVTAQNVEGEVLTNEDGKFIFPIINYPEENKKEIILTIEKESYTYAQRKTIVTSTRDTSVEYIYLALLDTQVTTITSDGGTTVNSKGTLQIIFPENAVGESIEVIGTVYEKGRELPAPLPETSFFTYACDLEPDGVTFAAPVQVRIANSRGFAPNTPIPVGYYNKETASWEHESMAMVSGDGQWVDFYVEHFSPRDINFPAVVVGAATGPAPDKVDDTTSSNKDQEKDKKDPGISISSGTLTLEHIIPSVRVLGKSQPLIFTYTSDSANPTSLIGTQTRLDLPPDELPQTTGWELSVEGIRHEAKFTAENGDFNQTFLFDGKNARGEILSTGSYDYLIKLSNDYWTEYYRADYFGGPPTQPTGIYASSPKSQETSVQGKVIINNQQNSPFGAGWMLSGLQRLHFSPDGTILLTDGDGSSIIFSHAFSPVAETSRVPFTNTINPTMFCFNSKGDVYAIGTREGDWHPNIYKITSDGEVTLFTDEILYPYEIGIDVMDNLLVYGIRLVQEGTPHLEQAIFRITPDAQISIYANVSSITTFTINKQGIIYAGTFDGSVGSIVKVLGDGTIEPFVSGLTYIADMEFGPGSNLYIVQDYQDYDEILKINPQGEVSTVVEGGTFNSIYMAFSVEGILYFSASPWGINTRNIYVLTPAGPSIKFLSPNPLPQVYCLPRYLLFDKFNNLFFTDDLGGIYKLSATGTILSYLPAVGDYSRLILNDNGTFTRILKNGTKINFTEEGLHTSTVDRNDNTTTYTYDEDGKLLNITDAVGGITQFNYSNGYLTSVTDPVGRITQFNIGSEGNLVSITNTDGAVTKYNYDETHLINSVTDALNNTTGYVHGPEGIYTQIVFPVGETIDFVPSKMQGLINALPEGTGTPENPASPSPAFMLSLLTNGNGFTTTYQTDKFGAATKETDPLGRITGIERDVNSNPVKIIQPNDSIVEMDYDCTGNLLSIKEEAVNATTSFIYESQFNQVTSITDPEGNTTIIDYDEKGNPVKITDDLSNQTTFVYDDRGMLTSVTDPLGNTTTFTYDTKGNLTSPIDPLGNTTTLNYDNAGNVISSTDAEGKTTHFAYDVLNRLTSVTDADNKTTHYTYDLAGNLISITDAKGNSTAFYYDEVNQVIQVTNPLGETKTYSYDSNRNLVSTTDANGNNIAFTYDSADQLIQKILPDNTVNFTYDEMGNIILVTDNDSGVSFEYDLASRLIATTTGNPAVSINYTYNKNGNRTTMSDPTGTTNYIYDALNRLTTITNPQGETTNYNYDSLSRRISMTLPNGIATNYTYDSASQLTSISSSAVSYQYNYDGVGNKISAIEPAGIHSYTYDVLERLTSATHPQPSNPAENFTYDSVGNRLSSHISASYFYNNANRLLEDEQSIYMYDNNGNMISKTNKANSADVTTYVYNAENQFISLYSLLSTCYYSYDGLGRRIEKNVNGTITKYVYDGEDILLEYDGTNSLTARYTHGPGIDEPISMERNGQSYFYHVDGLGSVTALTNLSGTAVQTYIYDSFGNIISQTGSLVNPYACTGREFDAESGLYFYRARYYDARIGRFLQEDPIGYWGGINLYIYCGNNSINWIDPYGLFVFGHRPLKGRLWIPGLSGNRILNRSNLELSHEHGFFEDGTGDNIGFRKSGQFSEDPTGMGYRYDTTHYDDALMREALKNVKDGKYSWLWNNCQDWAAHLRKEYERLKEERKNGKKENSKYDEFNQRETD